jgi:hypothetical protein
MADAMDTTLDLAKDGTATGEHDENLAVALGSYDEANSLEIDVGYSFNQLSVHASDPNFRIQSFH